MWQTIHRKIIKCVLDVKWECDVMQTGKYGNRKMIDVKVDMYVNKTERQMVQT